MTGLELLAAAGGVFGQPAPCLAMLAGAYAMQRSLGSWPVLWLAAAVGSVDPAVQLVLAGTADWLAAAGSLAMPLALFVLARHQLVPGLRRGRMTDGERQRWIMRHALAPDAPAAAWPAVPGRGRALTR